MSRVRVLIVEDSAVVREFLQCLIGSDPRLEVAAVAESAEQALRLLERLAPDVIALDIRLPGMNGFEATRRIMAEKPTPIVLISASVDTRDLDLSMRALEAGALAVLAKPVARTQDDYEGLAERLCTQLAIMSQVRVVRQRMRPEYHPGPGLPGDSAARAYHALGIATSTGGPGALVELLSGLGKDFPLPVLVVQHLTPSFRKAFGLWLAGVCPLPVEMVDGQTPASPGRVYLAGSDRHLALRGSLVCAEPGDPVGAHRPSADVLFQSMAQNPGGAAIGVLLTGMGSDGAAGMAELRRAGGYTLAEDESTAVVYGMPAAAVSLGAVCESLPLGALAPRVLELAGSPWRAAR